MQGAATPKIGILDIEKNQGILLPENRDIGFHKVRKGYWDNDLIEKGHRFGLDLDLFWSGFGFNLESILVSVCILIRSPFWIAFGHVLDSDRFQFRFGLNLDWDW